MSVYHHIRGQLVVKDFFQQDLIFLENLVSFAFTLLTKHIKIILPLQYKSVCGRVVKSSGLSSALSSGLSSAPLQVRVSTVLDSPIIFFSVILNYSTVSQLFIADLLYFIISYYTSSSSH